MSKMAAAIKAHAVRLPVTQISLKAQNAAANWSRIEMTNMIVIFIFSLLKQLAPARILL
jgi:hypothetical protein